MKSTIENNETEILNELYELKLANKNLENQNQQLQYETEKQRLVLSKIAHDVRDPISTIKGLVDFEKSNTLSNFETEKINNLFSEQLETTLSLLNNLIDWSKTEVDDLGMENINLHELSESVLNQFRTKAKNKNNLLVNFVDRDLYLHTNSHKIRFILRNLISNANKFTQKGSITLYAHGEKNRIVFTVSDTGNGMLQEKIKYLFDTPNHENKSGLGLLLTKSFMDELNGNIEVKSEVGKGTTFFLYFNK